MKRTEGTDLFLDRIPKNEFRCWKGFCLNCISLMFSTDYVSSVIGVTGGKVALPCNITPPTYDDAVSLILWYKDESTTPIYRYEIIAFVLIKYFS